MPNVRKGVNRPEKKSSFAIVILFFTVAVFAIATGIAGGFFFWTLSDLPKIEILEEYYPSESSLVYSAKGDVLAEFYVERRIFIPGSRIPDHVKEAFIAVEDARFYKHHGIDFIRIVGALIQDIKAGAFVQGGSTITQQLAKMLFLKPERSIKRKIKEAALSIQIEKHYTKDEILALYLNQAYFGARAYGIESASQTYFGKTAEHISIAEAALLAALPKAPSKYSPYKNPKKALKRRNYAIGRLLHNKFINSREYRSAISEPIPTTIHRRKYRAPYFVEHIRNDLEKKYGDNLYTEGLKIYTSLDYRMQEIAENAVENGIKEIEKRRRDGIQAALLAVERKSGKIKALVGGNDFWDTQFNRALQAKRQPGSAFKPIVYLTALNQGFISEDLIIDNEVTYTGKNERDLWTPQNYNKEFNGEVKLITALARSLNAATVCLADIVGIENVIKTAREIGIRSKVLPYLPSALGASDMTLPDLVYAYGVLSHGKSISPVFYEKVTNRDGLILEETIYNQKEILDAGVVIEMKDILRAVILEGTGRKAKSLNRVVYGKTGTTNDYTDAWFIGFDDNIILGVWVGRDNHTPIGKKETGASAALPIWIEFMKNI